MTADPARQRDIRAIHAMRRELALAEDSYRAIIARMTAGRVGSSADMTPDERRRLLDELRRLGAGKKTAPRKTANRRDGPLTPAPSPARGEGRNRPFRPANTKQQAMIRGLWLELAALGAFKDASEAALADYVRRQAKVDALQFVSADMAQSVIGGLKGWLARVKKERGL
ncbi:MAG TPA: regulatory protein GemA, partial [Azospirillaceae bacterium]|nr:regulatory protein GemA [Azospirillaceae bacterium]